MKIQIEKNWKDINKTFKKWAELRNFNWKDIKKLTVVFEDLPVLKVRTVRNRLNFSNLISKTQLSVNVIVSDSDYLNNMMNYLPWYERKSLIYFNLFNSVALELRLLEQKRLQIKNNIYLETAVESLKYQERDLGIKNTNYLSYKQRREQINSRYIAVFDQTNEETIKNICRAYSNGEVEIIEDEKVPGLYIIEFTGSLGVPDNIDGLKESLELVFPAHLGFNFKYRFINWGMLSKRKWKDLKTLTWKKLKFGRM